MKLSHVFRRRNLLLICLIASIVFSLAKISVPVSSSPETRVYVKMPDGYIPGVPVGNYFFVEVWIENAVDLVQWALSVRVDPAVLEVWGAQDGAGTVIKDYVDYLWWPDGDVFVVGEVDKPGGKIIDISHAINAWPDLYNDTICQEKIGMDAPGGFNGSGKLCRFRFKSLNATEYSTIHLYDVLLFDGLYWETKTPHYFPPDTVEDGHYNPPPPGDVAVINVVPSESQGYQTWTTHGIDINVTVLSNSTMTISFNVTAYYGSSTWYEIGTQNVTLPWRANTTLTFNWKPSGVAYGVYTIKANATLAGEIYLDNNEVIVYDAVKVKMVGDIDGNNYVGSWDLILLAAAYGSDPVDPNWNRQGDFDDDAYVGPIDVNVICANYGKSI